MAEIEQINMQELKQQVEDDEDEDGPPPGFQCIIAPQPTLGEKLEAAENDDEDEGPPPGFDSITPKPPSSLPSSGEKNIEKSNQPEDTEDDDGPPPGWEFHALANALPKPSSDTTVIKTERNEEVNDCEDEDEGPPPGWETVLPHKTLPAVEPLLAVSSDLEIGSKQDMANNDVEDSKSLSQSSPPTPLPQKVPSATNPAGEMSGKGDTKTRIKRASTGKQYASPHQLPPPTPHSSASSAGSASTEMAQLVCGTCRKLCTYPRGAKWVGCPSCREVNFVLEEHEVGQVKCGGCAILLMYQYRAAAVQCTSCRTVTQIGAHNRRAPLSAQQAQRRQRSNRRRR